MITIFDHLNSLVFKNKRSEDLNDDYLQTFLPYMVNRWFSFYGEAQAVFVNSTLNKYIGIFGTDKYRQYKFYEHIIPRCRFKRLSYIKKKKKAGKEEEIEHLELAAKNMQLSVRELKQYIALKQTLCK